MIHKNQLVKDTKPGDYVHPEDLKTIAAVSGQTHATYLRWAGMVNQTGRDAPVGAAGSRGANMRPNERLKLVYSILAAFPQADFVRWI
ncbi:hypothetical protein CPT_Seuss115 [Caulobacter phage Seuss]|uniref:Uncharacterized protein n=1 Tax=Caulobacter phage Seuss TaxID=1675601 RepID=A0A0K1LMA4_9CAUD|nr:hypothetical protein HOR08_gp115 [Caulobacter phage Seuss]AKU43641.1 hypothetical protein CPT_Seuss115 [Caulobacter phage Seuss]